MFFSQNAFYGFLVLFCGFPQSRKNRCLRDSIKHPLPSLFRGLSQFCDSRRVATFRRPGPPALLFFLWKHLELDCEKVFSPNDTYVKSIRHLGSSEVLASNGNFCDQAP